MIILLFFKTPSKSRPTKASLAHKLLHMDLVGTVLAMGIVVSYVLAFQHAGQSEAWNSSYVIGLLVGFGVMSIVFIVWEWQQGERAMVAPRLIKNRTMAAASAFTFFFAGAYFVSLYYLPIYFQSVDGISPVASGVRNLPLIIAVTIGTIGSGGFITSTGIATPLMVLGSVLVTIGAGLIYTLDIGSSTGEWIGYQVLAGLGWGLAFQIPIIVAQAMATPEDLSSATSIMLCELPTELSFSHNLYCFSQLVFQ